MVRSDIVHDRGPVFARQYLIHPKEGIVDCEEGYSNRISVTVNLRYAATEELHREDRSKESNEQHEHDQVEYPADISKHQHLREKVNMSS